MFETRPSNDAIDTAAALWPSPTACVRTNQKGIKDRRMALLAIPTSTATAAAVGCHVRLGCEDIHHHKTVLCAVSSICEARTINLEGAGCVWLCMPRCSPDASRGHLGFSMCCACSRTSRIPNTLFRRPALHSLMKQTAMVAAASRPSGM